MAKEEKTNLYLLAIVGIVAVVGIVVMILNSRAESVSTIEDSGMGSISAENLADGLPTSTDYTGEAFGVGVKKKCKVYCTDDPSCYYSGAECGSLQWSKRTTKADCSIGEDAMWTICNEDDADGDGDGADYAFSFWGTQALDYYS
ncbi:MAG: hypothetical protein AABX82_06205 [Nanoarchaeota archaeon]